MTGLARAGLIAVAVALAGCGVTRGAGLSEAGQGALYCYATLGEEDCHAAPLLGESGRLVGFVGPAPADLRGR